MSVSEFLCRCARARLRVLVMVCVCMFVCTRVPVLVPDALFNGIHGGFCVSKKT